MSPVAIQIPVQKPRIMVAERSDLLLRVIFDSSQKAKINPTDPEMSQPR